MKLILTHLIIGLLGFFLARTITSTTEEENEKDLDVTGSLRSSDFLAAWEAIPDQALSIKDRIATQKRLLREWAKIDLRSAFEASLAEAWDSDINQWEDSMTGPLASAFSNSFIEDPEGTWSLIQSGDLGVGASLLRHAWYKALSSKNPVALCQKLAEVAPNDIGHIIKLLRNNSFQNTESYQQIGDALLALPEHLVKTSDIVPYLKRRKPEEVLAALTEMESFETRKATILLQQLGRKYESHNLQSEGYTSMASLKSELKELPKEAQGKVLHSILTNHGSDTYWGGKEAGTGTLALIDVMIEGEHWEELASKGAWDRLDKQSDDLPDEDVAVWAANLPEREELKEIFHRGIDNYITNNMEKSWDWIQEFPQGIWRDRAFAEYSQQAWKEHDDYQASRRALDAISDPEFRKTAEDWRPPRIRNQDN